ncbi:O-succinylhomoserine sulfhydrylase [Rhodoluna lacicola]|jgi:O-succinylhomoserine sulfhydrylase|uniref:O-succinylhomoserine sulfhydrylase n=1 Tax=Rhodoluna lacicola TaxID=529884 RepID=A0A060JKS6_9MICO|nr:O-succinylhomoserine sulfhydrylase [Rhodoluna lacicola]AIC47173.1 O-succinylhomoserine sulfhydrylase [Rhodoluna lacicola]
MTQRTRPWGYQDPFDGKKPNWQLHPDTLALRAGLSRSGFGETGEALYLSSGFTYDSAEMAEAAFKEETAHHLYSRFSNPTVAMFEERLAALEGAEACFATATGMSAMFSSVACLVKAGDRIVASMSMFSSCYVVLNEILPAWGVEIELVDGNDKKKWADALAKPTKVVFIESPSNPMMEIVDIRMVSDLAHKVGATVIVDNVMGSPVLQKPLELGADVVMYSATKHIDGQGRVLGGAILGSKDYIKNSVIPFTRHTGQSMSAFNAWVMLKSLETLTMRVERMASNALKVAEFLSNEKKIESVSYPFLKSDKNYKLAKKQMRGGGTTIGFKIKGNKEKTFKFMNALRVIDISNNLGDSKSLITHPASTTHRRLGPEIQLQMGITPNLVRLSVGLENVDDLIADLKQALK